MAQWWQMAQNKGARGGGGMVKGGTGDGYRGGQGGLAKPKVVIGRRGAVTSRLGNGTGS